MSMTKSTRIYQYNIDDYIDEEYPTITELQWSLDDLDDSILKKFPNLQHIGCYCNKITTLELLSIYVNLKELNCYRNKITTLEPISSCVNLVKLDFSNNRVTTLKPISMCVNIQELSCWNNLITTLEPILSFVNLQILDCSHTQITTLEPLSSCTNLRWLRCYDTKIKTLEPLSSCVNLQELECAGNTISSLNPLSSCVNLYRLICCNNRIKSLEPLSACVNLRDLFCYNNQIKSLDPLSVCVNLRMLECQNNQITSLNPLIYLHHIDYLKIEGNPIEPPSIQVQRFLERIRRLNNKSSVYHDRQNVHDITIQKSVCDSLQNLLKDKKTDFNLDVIINSPLDDKTKNILIEYCQDESIHSIHLVTYQELLGYVWNRITKSDNKTELLKIFKEQISDSECKCFTGRFNRTLSVLVGFYDDIKVEISDNSRIGAIILLSKDQVDPYDVDAHKGLAMKLLIEAGYSESEVRSWIDAINE